MTDDRIRSDDRRVRIFLCGDVMTGRGVDQIMAHPVDPELRESYVKSALTYVRLAERVNGPILGPVRPDYVWGDGLTEWRRMAPDVRLINLETAVTRSDDFAPKAINYRMAPENAPCLAAAGVDGCTLANNHVLDFGVSGLLDTLEALQVLGVPAAGAGRDLAAAATPATIPLRGGAGRVILVGAAFEDSGVPPNWAASPHSPGVNLTAPTDEAAAGIAQAIREVRRPGDVAVVSIHWGSNWGHRVPQAHRFFAHALIDTGEVSIVHGHSSHHPRPAEVYRGRLVLYGCGDLLTDYEGIEGYEEFRCDLVAMYFADVERESGALAGLQLSPFLLRRMRLNRAPREDAAWLAETLTRESSPFGVGFRLGRSGRLTAGWQAVG